MVSIYCIEDINNLKYIGSTKHKLNKRLSKHKYHKKINKGCSSKLLDLDNCKIYELEECDESNRNEREQYWIDNIECVNQLNTLFDRKQFNKQYYQENKEYRKEHYQKNKEHMKEDMKQYYQKNKGIINQYNKQYYHYQNSWGGEKRTHNNLLKIDLSLFD